MDRTRIKRLQSEGHIAFLKDILAARAGPGQFASNCVAVALSTSGTIHLPKLGIHSVLLERSPLPAVSFWRNNVATGSNGQLSKQYKLANRCWLVFVALLFRAIVSEAARVAFTLYEERNSECIFQMACLLRHLISSNRFI